jgi:hypothetical protein
MTDLPLINGIFLKRRGYFGQTYKSVRFHDREITVDDLTGSIRICICTAYNEKLDNGKKGLGGGEVINEWYFKCEEEAKKFIDGMLK